MPQTRGQGKILSHTCQLSLSFIVTLLALKIKVGNSPLAVCRKGSHVASWLCLRWLKEMALFCYRRYKEQQEEELKSPLSSSLPKLRTFSYNWPDKITPIYLFFGASLVARFSWWFIEKWQLWSLSGCYCSWHCRIRSECDSSWRDPDNWTIHYFFL